MMSCTCGPCIQHHLDFWKISTPLPSTLFICFAMLACWTMSFFFVANLVATANCFFLLSSSRKSYGISPSKLTPTCTCEFFLSFHCTFWPHTCQMVSPSNNIFMQAKTMFMHQNYLEEMVSPHIVLSTETTSMQDHKSQIYPGWFQCPSLQSMLLLHFNNCSVAVRL